MTVSLSEKGDFESVSGNTCPRGATYARQEFTNPVRMITAVIPADGSPVPLSVKTSKPVPKSIIPQIMQELGKIHVSAPVKNGTVIISDVLHTGSDIIATRQITSN